MTPRAARGLGAGQAGSFAPDLAADVPGLLAFLVALVLLMGDSVGLPAFAPGDRTALVLAAFLAIVPLFPPRSKPRLSAGPVAPDDDERVSGPWLGALGLVAFALPPVGWALGLAASAGGDLRALGLGLALPGILMLAGLGRALHAGHRAFPWLWFGLGLALPLFAGVLRWVEGEVPAALAFLASVSPLDWAFGAVAADGAPAWTSSLAPLAFVLACAALPAAAKEREA